ncbi:MAG: hypothetical protein P4L33_11350 [Capsulimonadaceae bacterium]|nr:hypothetical protein [Capsulimonadaceae bacterium]
MHCAKLPGTLAPERQVFADLKAHNSPQLSERFGIEAGDLHPCLETAITELDHHEWRAKVAERIGSNANHLWCAMAKEWAKTIQAETVKAVVGLIRQKLS